MKLQKRVITAFSIVMISFMGLYHTAIAETQVSGEELKTLLSGNTTEKSIR